MFSLNINPVLFKIGFLEIRYYGLVYVLGVVLVYFYLKKKNILSQAKLEKFLFFLVLGMFLGARIFALNLNLIKDPLEFFRVWNGGMSFFGGFLGGILGGYYVLREKILETADLAIIPISFVLIFGRLANFVNQELVGKITNKSWCFNFSNYIGCRHPYQLYFALGHLVLFLYLYHESKKVYRKGELFFKFILGYGILRLILDFFKEKTELIFGLDGWQFFAIGFILVGVFYLFKKRKLLKI